MDEQREVLDYLQAHRVMTLATFGPEGPAAAAVFYANRGLSFYFLSAPGTLHCRNLLLDPRVAATIHEDYAEWRAIRGVQMTGTVRELAGEERDAAQQLYEVKFPEITGGAVPGALARALLRIRWYELSATRIRFIDNARSFGHRQEWSREELTGP